MQTSGAPPNEPKNRCHQPHYRGHQQQNGSCARDRRAGRRDPESGKRCEFLAIHCHLSPKTIADIYRDRWQIELFFKEIKQDLRIKSLVDNSENAVLIQICTTLTVCPLLSTRNSSAAPGCPCGNFSSLSRSTCLARPP